MSFETRHAERKRILDRIILAAQVVAVLYLATHALITWRAWEIDGILAAVFTFILLGFGDLYWGLRWAHEGDEPWLASIALAAAALCFASWIMRPMFNRWAIRFAASMLEDVGSEIERIRDGADTVGSGTEDQGTDEEESEDKGRPTGGGARPLE